MEERQSLERHQRRAMEEFRHRLKRLEPAVALGDTWEQVRPRVEKYDEYRALDSDETRRAAFDKYMRRLKEKEEDLERDRNGRREFRERERENRSGRDSNREYRNGHGDSHRRHRTRTRSPEPDAYEADRRKATADRETRHRQGGTTGLSPPHRRDRDHRDRDRDRYDRSTRQVSVSHYDRERREREAEREQNYISRADPRERASELDYGDSRPTPTRRRRDSDGGSPSSRRDSKVSRNLLIL